MRTWEVIAATAVLALLAARTCDQWTADAAHRAERAKIDEAISRTQAAMARAQAAVVDAELADAALERTGGDAAHKDAAAKLALAKDAVAKAQAALDGIKR